MFQIFANVTEELNKLTILVCLFLCFYISFQKYGRVENRESKINQTFCSFDPVNNPVNKKKKSLCQPLPSQSSIPLLYVTCRLEFRSPLSWSWLRQLLLKYPQKQWTGRLSILSLVSTMTKTARFKSLANSEILLNPAQSSKSLPSS